MTAAAAVFHDAAQRAAEVARLGQGADATVAAAFTNNGLAPSDVEEVDRGFQTFRRAVIDAVKVANAAYERDGGLAGISTGLVDLDKRLGGLHPSDLLILAGRPSMGKTSLATNIAFNIARGYRKGTKPDGSEGAVDGGVVGFWPCEGGDAEDGLTKREKASLNSETCSSVSASACSHMSARAVPLLCPR